MVAATDDGRDVEHDDAPFVRAAVVEALAVRRERTAHVRTGAERVARSRISVPMRRHAAHGVRFAQIDELERVLVQDGGARSIGAQRQPPRVRLRAQHAPGRRHAAAIHEDGRVPVDVRPRIAAGRLERRSPRVGSPAASKCDHKEDRDQDSARGLRQHDGRLARRNAGSVDRSRNSCETVSSSPGTFLTGELT